MAAGRGFGSVRLGFLVSALFLFATASVGATPVQFTLDCKYLTRLADHGDGGVLWDLDGAGPHEPLRVVWEDANHNGTLDDGETIRQQGPMGVKFQGKIPRDGGPVDAALTLSNLSVTAGANSGAMNAIRGGTADWRIDLSNGQTFEGKIQYTPADELVFNHLRVVDNGGDPRLSLALRGGLTDDLELGLAFRGLGTSIPEPGTFALAMLGLAGFGYWNRKRQRG